MINCSIEAKGAAWQTDCKLLNPVTGEDSWKPAKSEQRTRYLSMRDLWLRRDDPAKAPPRAAGQLWLGLGADDEFADDVLGDGHTRGDVTKS